MTVGDFASQALTLSSLRRSFPLDSFVAEEGSESLRSDIGLSNRVLDAVVAATAGRYGDAATPLWKGGAEGLWHAVDLGRTYDTRDGAYLSEDTGRGRVWCLDPIDGTKGFLRGKRDGGQYCVALALIEVCFPLLFFFLLSASRP